MNKILLGALASVGLTAAAGTIVIAAGVVDVGADTPHAPLVHQLLELTRERSIARRAADIAAPENLTDPERIRRGAGNYAAMCVDCHLAPELPDSEIRQGLYPGPPNLSLPGDAPPAARNAVRQFWIIKHGIKASGMPAWSKGGMEDEAIWDLVAFLQQMPALTNAAYEQLVASSEGHSHAGMAGHGDAGEAPDATRPAAETSAPAKADKKHDHAAHDHSKHRH